MTAATNFLEAEWMKYTFTSDTMGARPTEWYIALHTADPGETGATGECSYAGYARQEVTFSQTDNTVTSVDSQTFPPVAGSPVTITHMSVWDALSGGNCLYKGALDLGKTFAESDVPNFGAGEIILGVD